MAATIIISALLIAVVLVILFYLIKKRKKGRGLCGGNCEECGLNGNCRKKPEK